MWKKKGKSYELTITVADVNAGIGERFLPSVEMTESFFACFRECLNHGDASKINSMSR